MVVYHSECYQKKRNSIVLSPICRTLQVLPQPCPVCKKEITKENKNIVYN